MAMWCPKCKTKSPALAVGHDELICAHCSSEVHAEVPKPKGLRKRKSTRASSIKVTAEETRSTNNPKRPSSRTANSRRTSQKSERSSLPEVAFIERLPPQTKPARKSKPRPKHKPKLKPPVEQQEPVENANIARKWRTDDAHTSSGTSHAHSQDRLPEQHDARPAPKAAAVPRRGPAKYLMIQLGLLIYLVGHGLTMWAFLAGNFGAWTVGSFCSVGGVVIALISVVHALRQVEAPNQQCPPRRRTRQ